MFKKLTGVVAALAMALLVSAAPASAAVSIDANGYGFVGKGDVQLAYGWNNKQLQENASGVSFSYESTESYDAVCEWTTGTRNVQTHRVTRSESTGVNAAVTYEARRSNQITGFTLTGFGATTSTGDVPAVGDSCPNGNNGVITSVTRTDTTGGLYVVYGGVAVLLQ